MKSEDFLEMLNEDPEYMRDIMILGRDHHVKIRRFAAAQKDAVLSEREHSKKKNPCGVIFGTQTYHVNINKKEWEQYVRADTKYMHKMARQASLNKQRGVVKERPNQLRVFNMILRFKRAMKKAWLNKKVKKTPRKKLDSVSAMQKVIEDLQEKILLVELVNVKYPENNTIKRKLKQLKKTVQEVQQILDSVHTKQAILSSKLDNFLANTSQGATSTHSINPIPSFLSFPKLSP
jgi:hypothetical protein